MQVYRDQTLPLADYYRLQHKYVEVMGEGTVEVIFDRLCREVDRAIRSM